MMKARLMMAILAACSGKPTSQAADAARIDAHRPVDASMRTDAPRSITDASPADAPRLDAAPAVVDGAPADAPCFCPDGCCAAAACMIGLSDQECGAHGSACVDCSVKGQACLNGFCAN